MIKTDKNKYKYDFSLNTTEERSELIEDKLDFIFNIKPYMIMGYSSENMDGDKKYDRIPKLIDGYTTYYLKAKNAGSSRKTEYSYYTCRKDEMRRIGNKVLYSESEPFDGYSDNDDTYSASEIVADMSVSMQNVDFGYENINTKVLKYAINSGKLNKGDVKRLLSQSLDLLTENKDKELSESLEQIIFNCYIQAKDSVDENIIMEYVKGNSLRDIAEKMGVSAPTVMRRLDKMLSWI